MSDLLARSTFELIPMKGAEEKLALLPPGSKVSITASPKKGMNATIDLAVHAQRRGYQATPHLSARQVQDRSELDEIIDRLAGDGISRTLVIGGDHDEPGKFKDALDLLRGLDELGHHFTEIGIAGYPEGHPYISGDLLREALIQKQRYATYITTQMCFDVAAIGTWIRGTRIDGVRLPVEIGIPGVIDPKKLVGIATRIGVGTSIRYLLKNRGFIGVCSDRRSSSPASWCPS